MSDFLSIKLDKDSGTPIYQQLGDALCRLIEEGLLKPNTQLPPIRKMASQLKINAVTVVSAYKYLEDKRVVYSKMGSGTYVSDLQIRELPEPILKNQYNSPKRIDFDVKNAINFANSSTSTELFPVEEFKTLFNQVLDRDKGMAFSYQESQGYEPLRQAICVYLEGYGIKTGPDKIQIISGAQQGIDLISKTMLGPGDVLFVEQPTYYGAVGAFLSRGAQVVEVPLAADGIDLDKLESLLKIYRPKFIYVMTYFQTPTCISYSMAKKKSLLELCYQYNTYIVEEDNQSEFQYKSEPVTPLKALDYKNRVVYIKSFSKILMPGLRLGFMVLPKSILRKTLNSKYTTDIATSGFIQRAFELYLNGPGWQRQVTYMKSVFRKRYDLAVDSLSRHTYGKIGFDPPEGGLNLWLKIMNPKEKTEELCNRLVSRNVIVTPGAVFYMSGMEAPFIRLSFAAVEKYEIEKGVAILGDSLK